MKRSTLLTIIAAGSLAITATLFGQTTKMTGTVVSVTRSTITLKTGNDQWVIRRQPSQTIAGDLKAGEEITITYNQPDAQKKEEPMAGMPNAEKK